MYFVECKSGGEIGNWFTVRLKRKRTLSCEQKVGPKGPVRVAATAWKPCVTRKWKGGSFINYFIKKRIAIIGLLWPCSYSRSSQHHWNKEKNMVSKNKHCFVYSVTSKHVWRTEAEGRVIHMLRNKNEKKTGIRMHCPNHCTAGIKKIYYAISSFPKKHGRGRQEKSMDNKCTNNV